MEYNLVKFTEQYQREIESDQFLIGMNNTLNDDCLIEIVKYLDIGGILRISLYNQRMLNICKYATKQITANINSSNKIPLLFKLIYLLSCLGFSRTLKSLELVFEDEDSFCCPNERINIIQKVTETIGSQIQEIRISARGLSDDELRWISARTTLDRFGRVSLLPI